MSVCKQCGADLTGIKITEWVSKKDGKQKKAIWCPNKHANYINDTKQVIPQSIQKDTDLKVIQVQLDEINRKLDEILARM